VISQRFTHSLGTWGAPRAGKKEEKLWAEGGYSARGASGLPSVVLRAVMIVPINPSGRGFVLPQRQFAGALVCIGNSAVGLCRLGDGRERTQVQVAGFFRGPGSPRFSPGPWAFLGCQVLDQRLGGIASGLPLGGGLGANAGRTSTARVGGGAAVFGTGAPPGGRRGRDGGPGADSEATASGRRERRC